MRHQGKWRQNILLLVTVCLLGFSSCAVATGQKKELTPEERAEIEARFPEEVFSYFGFYLDGQIYPLFLDYDTLAENGWVDPDHKQNAIHAPNFSLNQEEGDYIEKNGVRLPVGYAIPNFPKDFISDIYFDEAGKNQYTLLLPGGIEFGSTTEEVIAAYGKPGWSENRGDHVEFIYFRNPFPQTSESFMRIIFSKDNEITGIYYHCLFEMDWRNAAHMGLGTPEYAGEGITGGESSSDLDGRVN